MRQFLCTLALFGLAFPISLRAEDPAPHRPKNSKPDSEFGGLPGEFINPQDPSVFDRFSINMPPTVAVACAEESKGGAIRIIMTITHNRTQEREETSPLGKHTRVTVQPNVAITETTVDYENRSARRGTEVFDVKGNRVEAKTILTMLKKHSPVLISCHGTVDPFYLRLVKEDTLVIVLGTRDGSEGRVQKLLKP